MISIVSNSFGNLMFAYACMLIMRGKLEISLFEEPYIYIYRLNHPVRTKETEAIMVLL